MSMYTPCGCRKPSMATPYQRLKTAIRSLIFVPLSFVKLPQVVSCTPFSKFYLILVAASSGTGGWTVHVVSSDNFTGFVRKSLTSWLVACLYPTNLVVYVTWSLISPANTFQNDENVFRTRIGATSGIIWSFERQRSRKILNWVLYQISLYIISAPSNYLHHGIQW